MHEHEGLENHSVEGGLVGGVIKSKLSARVCVKVCLVNVERSLLGEGQLEHSLTGKKHDQKHDDLVNALADNVTPHRWIHNLLETGLGLTLKKRLGGWLSRQSQSSESVHDKVNPQHLHSGEWWISEDDGTREHNKQSHKIHSDLELEELSDTVVDVTAILNCGQN